MRNATIAGIVTLVLGLWALPCAAQRDYRGGWQGGHPPGDYVQTCRNIFMQGNRLVAECQKRNGDWRRTTLDNVSSCGGNIANDNGRLVCPKGSGPGFGYGSNQPWRGGIPGGTYTQSCRDIRVEGNSLVAKCQRRNGDWRETSLRNFQRCPSAPANDDGRLVCGR